MKKVSAPRNATEPGITRRQMRSTDEPSPVTSVGWNDRPVERFGLLRFSLPVAERNRAYYCFAEDKQRLPNATTSPIPEVTDIWNRGPMHQKQQSRIQSYI
ncbi:Hypothetical predicted protein [Mytilus galloprovincialis]|uniref:Uncharacterized protein n=1 Tax=Mytilus galloprovincialis TaxID=29158 RepID=A0A8B6G4M8_MYTGA|nr:Hypothetical predicted protein [Mytilus galloprovincialis]